MHINLNQEYYYTTTITKESWIASSQFSVLSGGLIEFLDEPWHVGVCAAGSLHTTTLLSIPQDIIRV